MFRNPTSQYETSAAGVWLSHEWFADRDGLDELKLERDHDVDSLDESFEHCKYTIKSLTTSSIKARTSVVSISTTKTVKSSSTIGSSSTFHAPSSTSTTFYSNQLMWTHEHAHQFARRLLSTPMMGGHTRKFYARSSIAVPSPSAPDGSELFSVGARAETPHSCLWLTVAFGNTYYRSSSIGESQTPSTRRLEDAAGPPKLAKLPRQAVRQHPARCTSTLP